MNKLRRDELEKVNGGAGGGYGGTAAFRPKQYVYRKGYGDQHFKIVRITDNIELRIDLHNRDKFRYDIVLMDGCQGHYDTMKTHTTFYGVPEEELSDSPF